MPIRRLSSLPKSPSLLRAHCVFQNETSRWNKAVLQRNKGLEYVEEHKLKGTIYFMDDDNTYHPMVSKVTMK